MTKVKVKTRSSSLESFSRNPGPAPGVVCSVSYASRVRDDCYRQRYLGIGWPLTRTNSRGAESPEARDADTLVAGNAFGTMFTEVRRFGLAMTAEEMDTAREGQHLGGYRCEGRHRAGHQLRARRIHGCAEHCTGPRSQRSLSCRTAGNRARLTSILVSKIERCALVGHAADVAHLGAGISRVVDNRLSAEWQNRTSQVEAVGGSRNPNEVPGW
jgi:hypothetical protein